MTAFAPKEPMGLPSSRTRLRVVFCGGDGEEEEEEGHKIRVSL